MRAVRHFVTLLLVCTGLVFVQGFSSATTASPDQSPAKSLAEPDPSLLKQLRGEARGSVQVTGESATKRIGFISAGLNGDLLPSNNARAVDKAAAFVNKYGALLGATGSSQLRQTSRSSDKYGTTVTYKQVYRGVPVFGGTILAHLDETGNLTAVNGTAVPGLNMSVTPKLSKQQAGKAAVRAVKADPPTSEDGKAASTAGSRAVTTDLMVYRTGLVRGETGDNYLAYRVEVTNRANIRDIVFLHAGFGKVLNRYSMVENAHDGLERILYEEDPASEPVWQEGDPFPGTLDEDQRNIVEASGESYHFFKNAFGRNSYDNAGAHMRTVNNDPGISCPNANWNGATTNYCSGVTSDDVVAHEWGHAYTEYTHNLIYQYQPGALNESYSDIWGETVDLINGRQDEGEGDITKKRADNACTTNTGAKPVVVINSPEDIARVCPAGGASFGPQLNGTGVTGNVVQATDVAEPPAGTTTDGCSTITNAAAVQGKIAIIDRGGCVFTQKVKNAQNAGATAVIIGNNVPGAPFSMSGADPTITIPSAMISQDNRNAIVSKPPNTVNVTMKDAGGVRENSFRWLVGEKSTAFGGAIRDMWTPTCVGDPGKVSDAEYFCGTSDQGGVHSNSGVPNHGYALLVDGGTYNGRTLAGIGLTKAAHLYWRAQTEYQTETTDFADHADALDASCTDLIGKEVNGLSTAGSPEDNNAPPALPNRTIAATDCAQVAAMAEAVELRKEPTQCNYQPLLAKNAPSLCDPNNQKRNTVYKEDFSDGLGAWQRSETWVFADQPFRWKVEATLPGNRSGEAAYAVDPNGGSCGGDADDYSGVMQLQSDPILIPGSNQRSPRLSFKHYVATEAGYDGGNVKVSVNDGPFSLVPSSAFIFNAYNAKMISAPGNTSPLAGEDGFTGTDGGEVTGSWGKSQIDLTMIGAESGDSVEVRFDMGMDGCSGNDGWYVDDVMVSTCKAPTKTKAEQVNRPSRQGTAPVVKVNVESLGGQGDPTGEVIVRVPQSRILGTDQLRNGHTRVALPESMRVGVHELLARYVGSDLHATSADRFTVRVVR